MDIFIPIPSTYAPPSRNSRQENRNNPRHVGEDRPKTDGKDKQPAGKQSSTGRRRAFSARSTQSQITARSRSGSRSRSKSRTRAKTRRRTKQHAPGGGAIDDGSAHEAVDKNDRDNGHNGRGVGIAIIEKAITALAMPAERPSVGRQHQSQEWPGVAGPNSPSREGVAQVLNPAAPPRSITIPLTTTTTTTTTTAAAPCASDSARPSSTRPTRNNINTTDKPLPTLPSAVSTRGRAASTSAADIVADADPASTTLAWAGRRTGGPSASASASAITAASARDRALTSSHSVANGSPSTVRTSKIHLPTATSSHAGAGLGVGFGAGAGASILPSRSVHRHPSNHHAAMVPDPSQSSSSTKSSSTSAAFRRTGSVSSTSVSGASHSHRAGIMTSSDNLPPSSHEGSGSVSNISATSNILRNRGSVGPKPLIIRNGRTYIHDEQLPYPLPVDLAELHRQSLRTLLLFQLFGGPIISTAFSAKPPQRILEVGCGSGFWSMMCHRYFAQHGHGGISFTGIDIVPLCGTGPDPNSKPDKDMNWRFIQHDMRRTPWPVKDGEFDLVMVKDMSCAAPGQFSQVFMDEYLRILRPGGVLEIWETDMSMRMLRPHVPATPAAAVTEDSESDSDDEDDAARLGVYVVSANTPLSAPLNQFLVEYNAWLSKALDKRYLSAVPCTMIGPMLFQEDGLIDVRSKRLAVPLSEVRWEREGVGGVVTKDGKSYIDSMKGKGKVNDPKAGKGGKSLTPAQAAIRRTALETSVGLIQALEPMLRDVSGKSQDEWDGWAGKMMNDLLKDGGTSWGECLEIGAWSARRKK
ncbi:methyltransferase domain-containing protein [Seiridium cupressi]